MYIALVVDQRPWLFKENHKSDLAAKLCIFTILMLMAAGARPKPEDAAIDQRALSTMILLALILTLAFVLVQGIRLLGLKHLNSIDKTLMRLEFAHQVDSTFRLLGVKSASEIENWILELRDNDSLKLRCAVDTIQCTLLGLMPVSRFRQRVDVTNVPVKPSTNAELFQRLLDANALRPDDVRTLTCQFVQALEHIVHDSRAKQHTRLHRVKSRAAGIHSSIHLFSQSLQCDTTGMLESESFVRQVTTAFSDANVRPFTKDELGNIFGFLSGGDPKTVSLERLEAALQHARGFVDKTQSPALLVGMYEPEASNGSSMEAVAPEPVLQEAAGRHDAEKLCDQVLVSSAQAMSNSLQETSQRDKFSL